MRFDTILVANRGEIAMRVIRTARALGYRTVAVYSDADARAPHVAAADHAVHIGPAPAQESYLDMDRILDAARTASAQAIHPGYGFLSENSAFAAACEEAGFVFIGPTPEAIALMGNKAAAKRRMIEAGVPCVPGYEGEDQSDAGLTAEAARIGFPVMVKAAAGGGGRGMRRVADSAALADALRLARSEAENAFGSGELILEKAIDRARHVEVQVFADTHGTVIHLGERDCSVQRRHQKVIEEAPCPVMTDDLRVRMGAAAVEAARAIGYRGAGTVEFLLDAEGAFYFLEMNTRLQVEHPVTELVTGLDLVALQLRVAQGDPLGLTQADVALTGHAIEVRLYAEDPAQDFLPSTGRIELWAPPSGEGVRVDAGIASGLDVPPFYDPMIAKVMAHGPTRDAARRRLVAALERTGIFGPASNRDFLIAALSHESFAAGAATTGFLEEAYSGPLAPETDAAAMAAAAVLLYRASRARAARAAAHMPAELLNWSSTGRLATTFRFAREGDPLDVTAVAAGHERWFVETGGRTLDIACTPISGNRARLVIDGTAHEAVFAVPEPGTVHLSLGPVSHTLRDLFALTGEEAETGGGGHVTAPMHGQILEVLVAQGAQVSRGDRLAVLEAMKMQHQITAAVDGEVTAVHCASGAQVGAGDLLMEIATGDDA